MISYINTLLIFVVASKINAVHHISLKFVIGKTTIKCHARNNNHIKSIRDAVLSVKHDSQILNNDDHDDHDESCVVPSCSIFSAGHKIELKSEVEITHQTISNAIILIEGGFIISKLEDLSEKQLEAHMWVFGVLHHSVSYFRSIVNLCRALQNLETSLKCAFYDVILNPMILVEIPRQIPNVEIVMGADKEPVILDDGFPNLQKYLNKLNLDSGIVSIQNDVSEKISPFVCVEGDDRSSSKVVDPLVHSHIYWKETAVQCTIQRPSYLDGTRITEAPDFVLKHLLNEEHDTDLDLFYIVYTLLEDCSSCESSIPHLKELKESSRTTKNNLYFVACDKLPHVCKAQNITGFPTATAYKTISEKHVEECGLSAEHSYSIPFHGVFRSVDLIKWLEDVSDMGVHFGKPHDFHSGCNIHLIISTRNITSDKMPIDCVQSICQHLMYAECFILEPSHNFVFSITLQRKDGISSLIYQDGVSLTDTFSNNPGLHYGHEPHHYQHNISCSDHPALCLNMIQNFIISHSRMLVTELSPLLFHTSTSYKPLFGNLPVLIALLPHEYSLTNESIFMSDLQEIARQFYTQVAVSYVDVDLYPTWVSGMSPITEGLPPSDSWMFEYPRVLIFHLEEHERAAFLQITGEMLRKGDIVRFVERYLTGSVGMEPCYGI